MSKTNLAKYLRQSKRVRNDKVQSDIKEKILIPTTTVVASLERYAFYAHVDAID